MEYNINSQRISIFSTIFIIILWDVLSTYYGRSLSLFLFILLIAIGLASFRFKFTIHTDHLIYEILLFNKPIIQKEIYPDQVNQLKLIRVGWAKKSAIIKVKKGINIRLSVLEPQEAYEHLIGFAEKHDIMIFKTKDYLILERMK
ncbi:MULTISPECIES: hypothetical protein [Bacillaceae]|uniref:Uncharacterized protein n=1 Tax=Oceanobacillus caeni TaxID=405946 RepID=A0ABR5MIT9_9BACI|nr:MULTISPECIES: hypothetical protein [Bacillaceae]KPH74529.1 hypothetical protein AFL42_09895 [Oceanobacillus caeni]